MFRFSPALLDRALTYEQYVALSEKLFAEGRTTSADPHYNTPEILGYTKLNLARMRRLAKQTVIEPTLANVVKELPGLYVWVVLTESWCGDAAQSVPVLQAVAALSPNITFRLLLRDENPDVMNAYLTNGGRSIPKLIMLDADTLAELATWGPRPAELQAEMLRWRSEKLPLSEAVERAQYWYNADRSVSVQAELLRLIERR